MSFNRSHRPQLSVQSVDLDVEGGRVEDDYDEGWPTSSTLRWSARGPTAHMPTYGLAQSAKIHLKWARAGWADANRWPEALRHILRSPDVRTGALKGLLLSSVVLALVFVFELVLFPSAIFAKNMGSGGADEMGSVGNVFWLYPLVGGSYFLASTWTTDVAQAAYRAKHGRSTSLSTTLPAGTSRRLILESYRILLVINYSAMCFLLERIPYVGRGLSFGFMSLVDGYYCFEQSWVSRGWPLERRMRFCESRWAYFMAFGLPSTAVSYFHPSGLVNLMLFMLVFPICTVLAMLASPQPRVAPSTSAAFSPAATTPAVALSPFLPGRLPIFWPTVKLYRRIVRAFPNSAEAPSASLGARGWKDINRRPSFEPANGGVARQSAAAQFVGGAWGSAQPNGASAGAAWGSPQLGAGRWASPQLGGGQWASAGTAGIGSPGRPPSYVQSSQPAADFGPPPTASANRGPPPRAKAGGKKQD